MRPDPVQIENVLEYVWKWKVVPTWMVHFKFFRNHYEYGAYDFLHNARTKCLVTLVGSSQTRVHGWSLTEKGFRMIENRLPPLKDRGYASEAPMHDLTVSVIHGGVSMLLRDQTKIHLLTEQQIRRVDPECRPNWFPRRLERRPDGMWRILGGERDRVVALEVELSRKDATSYMDILQRYSITRDVHHVIWIVSTGAIRTTIWKAARTGMSAIPEHSWVTTLKEFKKSYLNSVLKNSTGKSATMRELVPLSSQVPSQVPGMIDPFKMAIYYSHISGKAPESELCKSGYCVSSTQRPLNANLRLIPFQSTSTKESSNV